MSIWKLFVDPSPGGYQDKNSVVRWLVARCSIVSGNTWTSLRIIGAVPVIYLFDYSPWISFIAFLFFAWTDWIDGKVARHRGEANGVGVWLDPTADKFFILILFWWFGCYQNNLFVPWLFWLLATVEFGGRLIIFLVWKLQRKIISQDDVKAKWWGKAKLTLQMLLGVGLYGSGFVSATWWQNFFDLMFWLVMIFAVISIVSHLWSIPEPFRKKTKCLD